MPEGDTVHKVAAVIREVLLEQVLEEARLPRVFDSGRVLKGRQVEQVEALGKHLLIHLEGALILRVHLGIGGSWHRYPSGNPWQRPASSATVVLGANGIQLVCFEAPQVELFPRRDRRTHPLLSRLGPDLLGEEPDLAEIVVRARRHSSGGRSIGEVLLDQRVAAGLGNVYKSELLFLGSWEDRSRPFYQPARGIHPWTFLSQLQETQLTGLYARGIVLLKANLGGWPRTTTFDHRRLRKPPPGNAHLWVYEKAGKPCRRCATRIQARGQGYQNRSTFWCPACQPMVSSGQ